MIGVWLQVISRALPKSLTAMAFVGPVRFPQGYRPVGVYCETCDMNLLVWRCYACGGQYCGRCIFRHRTIGSLTLGDVDAGWADANEVAEGMHAIYYGYYLRLGSEMASDPAGIAAFYCRFYLCVDRDA